MTLREIMADIEREVQIFVLDLQVMTLWTNRLFTPGFSAIYKEPKK